jgi:hypothetical protein
MSQAAPLGDASLPAASATDAFTAAFCWQPLFGGGGGGGVMIVGGGGPHDKSRRRKPRSEIRSILGATRKTDEFIEDWGRIR